MSEQTRPFIPKLRDTYWLPELPEAAAMDTLNRLRELESRIVQGSKMQQQAQPILVADYADGSAEYEDHILYANLRGDVLVSAEHATNPVRKVSGSNMGADHGTGGLALLVAEKDMATAIVPRGRQSPHSRTDQEHILKQAIRTLLPARHGLVSVHGMMPGKVSSQKDSTEFHAILGLGFPLNKQDLRPNEQSVIVAEKFVAKAKELGLRADIATGEGYKTFDLKRRRYEQDPDTGKPKLRKLTAEASSTMVRAAYAAMEGAAGRPAIQLELTRLLRLIPMDLENGWHKDEKARAMGVYLGYLLTRELVELIRQRPRQLL